MEGYILCDHEDTSWDRITSVSNYKENDRKAGMFEFEYSDTRGETRSLSYQLVHTLKDVCVSSQLG